MEFWKDVIGYPNYQISNLGNIKNKTKKKCVELNKGYYRVSLYNNSKSKHFLIHRLVAIHFIDNPEKKTCVNHINGIKIDNNVKNLEWCTQKENINHAYKTGLSKVRFGEKTKKNKITSDIALIILKSKKNSKGKRYWGLKELCEKLGISYGIGCEISKGNNWKHLNNNIL